MLYQLRCDYIELLFLRDFVGPQANDNTLRQREVATKNRASITQRTNAAVKQTVCLD